MDALCVWEVHGVMEADGHDVTERLEEEQGDGDVDAL